MDDTHVNVALLYQTASFGVILSTKSAQVSKVSFIASTTLRFRLFSMSEILHQAAHISSLSCSGVAPISFCRNSEAAVKS